jgi:hypothetical protein
VEADKRKPVAALWSNRGVNPYVGESMTQIMSTPGWEREVAASANYVRSHGQGNTRLHSYEYALSKVFSDFKEGNTELGEMLRAADLSLQEFIELLCSDDLVTSAIAAGEAAYSIYQKPAVKKFVNSMVSKGYKKIASYFSKPPIVDPVDRVSPGMAHVGADSVNLGYIFGALTNTLPPISDPNDVPKSVFTQRFEGEFNVSANASGACGVIIRSQAFYLALTSAGSSWLAVNNAVGYNPASNNSTGTWAGDVGPLSGSNSMFASARMLGTQVSVRPQVSLTNSQGVYTCGMVNSQLDTSSSFMTNSVYTFDQLSQLPYFAVYDMKTTAYTRSIPDNAGDMARWNNVAGGVMYDSANNTYGSFALILAGAAPSATFTISYSTTYSIQPSKTGNLLLRGTTPGFGAYSQRFVDYLRVRYPDLGMWPHQKVGELYEHLLSLGTDSYSKLIQGASYAYTHQATQTFAGKSYPSGEDDSFLE